jgi:hypothetical protein
MSSGSKVFDALLRRKSAELAEAFVESDDLLILFDNQQVFCFEHAVYCILNALRCEDNKTLI